MYERMNLGNELICKNENSPILPIHWTSLGPG